MFAETTRFSPDDIFFAAITFWIIISLYLLYWATPKWLLWSFWWSWFPVLALFSLFDNFFFEPIFLFHFLLFGLDFFNLILAWINSRMVNSIFLNRSEITFFITKLLHYSILLMYHNLRFFHNFFLGGNLTLNMIQSILYSFILAKFLLTKLKLPFQHMLFSKILVIRINSNLSPIPISLVLNNSFLKSQDIDPWHSIPLADDFLNNLRFSESWVLESIQFIFFVPILKV